MDEGDFHDEPLLKCASGRRAPPYGLPICTIENAILNWC